MSCRSKLSRRLKSASFLISVSLLAAFAISGCGSDGFINSSLVVPDAGNNRVLIYNPPFTTGENASIVLGQSSFTTNTPGTSASTMSNPSSVAFDSAGNLYVLESFFGSSGNRRVLLFKKPFATGMPASVVLGAPDFTTPGPDTNNITGLAVDKSGNVWVSTANVGPTGGSITEYAAPITSGMSPTLVLTAGLEGPWNMTFDAAGNLWVADDASSRVVEFAAPISASSKVALTIGQPAGSTPPYSANNGGISAATLYGPSGVAFDASGNLWVTDRGNSRLLEYKAPFSSGMAAQLVIGQGTDPTTDFSSSNSNQGLSAPSAATLGAPGAVSFVNGRLVVSDTVNNRTLIYNAPFTTGMSASVVLGQPGFTTNGANQGGLGAGTQSRPGGFSLLALTVAAGLAAIWFLWTQRRRRLA